MANSRRRAPSLTVHLVQRALYNHCPDPRRAGAAYSAPEARTASRPCFKPMCWHAMCSRTADRGQLGDRRELGFGIGSRANYAQHLDWADDVHRDGAHVGTHGLVNSLLMSWFASSLCGDHTFGLGNVIIWDHRHGQGKRIPELVSRGL